MTTPDAQYPDDQPTQPNRVVGHDLDPNTDGDLVLHVSLARTQALLLSANSTSGVNWSASVRWIDDATTDNEFVAESATDIELSGVQNDWARLVRKGPVAEVTFTSDSAGGTTNNINAFVGAHR